MFLELLLFACAGSLCKAGCEGSGSPTTGSDDTAPTDDTTVTDDSAPDDDTAVTDDTGTVADPCVTPRVMFVDDAGVEEDVSAALLDGTYLTLDRPGTLQVCAGVWYSHLLIRAEVEVVGLGVDRDATVLSGGGTGSVLDVAGPDGKLTVSNLTVDRGLGLSKEHNSGGGGIYCEAYGAIEVTNTVFSNHEANDGSAIYVEDCGVQISGSRFVGNVSEDDGGAVTVWYSDLSVSDSEFSVNEALDGGALALFYGTGRVVDTHFESNTASMFGGAIWVYNSSFDIATSQLSGNSTTGGDGGGLLFYGTGTLTDVGFAGNSAVRGGGIFVYYEASIVGDRCDFSRNSPDDLYVADYSAEGGVSQNLGEDANFICAANVCDEP